MKPPPPNQKNHFWPPAYLRMPLAGWADRNVIPSYVTESILKQLRRESFTENHEITNDF